MVITTHLQMTLLTVVVYTMISYYLLKQVGYRIYD